MTEHGANGKGGPVLDVLDPRFLRRQVEQIQDTDEPPLSDEDHAAVVEELDAAEQRIPPLVGPHADPAAGAVMPAAPRPDRAFFARHPALSIVQSTIEDCIASRFSELTEPPPPAIAENPHLPNAQLVSEDDLYRQFGPCDIGWIRSALAAGLRLLRGRATFPDTPAGPAVLGNEARMVMVGDWGSGLPSAHAVGRQMGEQLAAASGLDRHVVHLGDLYYSGWREEYTERFLPHWPHRLGDRTIKSWALNGNHDMYSGGHGYFGYLLRDERFAEQEGSSHFLLENDHWQILGLDTAYKDRDLAGTQADWVRERLAANGKRTILLSHHQPFSAYSEHRYPLWEALAEAFAVRRIDAWFWGHEHRCVVYEEHEHIKYPRLIGHGGVPVLADDDEAPPEGVRYEYREASEDDAGPVRWRLFGFVVLDFDGADVVVRYLNEDGGEHYPAETLVP